MQSAARPPILGRMGEGPPAAAIAENLRRARERIAAACARRGRDPAEINLLAVTKTVGAETVRRLAELGVKDVGESRVQEARAKAEALAGAGFAWHLVGHLQTNKIRPALELFSWIHSVASVKLLAGLERAAREAGRRVRVFLEVNTSGEPAKQGVAPAGLGELAAALAGAQFVEAAGLMTMGPLDPNPEAARPGFRLLKELRDRFAGPRLGRELSMGMSGDFEVAVEEGATWLRLGTALFRGAAG